MPEPLRADEPMVRVSKPPPGSPLRAGLIALALFALLWGFLHLWGAT